MFQDLNLTFSQPLLNWFDNHGRKNLPWKNPPTPYTVWISEIMLQQTQVQTVIPYFLRFMAQFPALETLAEASEDQVLALWAGLGYYSRARNLHKTAKIIVTEYHSIFPSDIEVLKTFPGIGESTAAAIASQAFNLSVPILDANVKRILARYFQVQGHSSKSAVSKRLWELAKNCMPAQYAANYTQAIMDLGALICKPQHPLCTDCPLQETCLSNQNKTTHLYPEKKQKKELPTQYMKFLLLHDGKQRIYLEKRPPAGIWGGLWSLPGIDMETCPDTFINQKYGVKSTKTYAFMQFKHSFTHFHLVLQALSMHTSSIAPPYTLHEPEGRWFSCAELSAVGLPRPIQKIVSSWFDASY